METMLVGLIGVSAAGYLIWRGYKSLGKSSDCAGGNCAGCSGGCACSTTPRKKT